MQIIQLTVISRNGATLPSPQAQLIDVDDIAAPLTATGSDSAFTLREGKKGPFPDHNTGTFITPYIVDETLSVIATAAQTIFTANVLTYKGRTLNPAAPLMGFNAKFVAARIIPWLTGSKFFYQEDSDPDLVEYTVSQTPAQILAQLTTNSPMTSIAVGQTIFVDATTGNDGTALRERFDRMFSTVEGAYGVAISGDTIVVYPGIYDISAPIGADGVNLEIMNGAIIGCNSDSISDGGADMVFKISGNGKINGITQAFDLSGAATSIEVDGVDVESTVSGAPSIFLLGGSSLKLRNTYIKNLSSDPGSHCIEKGDTSALILDNVKFIADPSNYAINASTPQDIKIITIASGNVDMVPLLITNLISGTVYYFDPAVE